MLKIYPIDNFFLSSSKIKKKNTFKKALQHLFIEFTLFNSVSYFKLEVKLKINSKMHTFKNLEEIWKSWKNFWKNKWQPCIMQFFK